MDFTGRFNTIGRDLDTGQFIVDLRVDQDVRGTFQKLKDVVLDIRISKHRKKRSLDANAYYWVLVTKISESLKVSKPFIHNQMLRRYGQIELFDGKAVYTVIPDTEDASRKVDEAEEYHLKPTSQVKYGKDGVMWRTYMMLRGSRTYDTREMSVLIDGVVSEANELGIETLPDTEIERMKREWGVDVARKD